MKLCILLVLFSFCSCSKNDGVPVNYESKLLKYDKLYDDYNDPKSYSDSRDNDGFLKNLRYEDQSNSNYDDMAKIDEGYEKYIGRQKNNNRYDGIKYSGPRRYNDEEMKERLDEIFGFNGPTANDEPENLLRPCALNDWQCIRKYFAANGKCKPSYGPIPDPLYLASYTFLFAVANVTITITNAQIRGLSSAKIRDFYVNKNSGNLVIAIDIQNLNQTSPRAYVRYRRTAKESIVLADAGTINFRSITFTAIIPKVPNLRLDLADVHADSQDSAPMLLFGPGVANSTDPDVQTAFAVFFSRLPLAIREAFNIQSQLLAAIYIQKNICDFGLKLISV